MESFDKIIQVGIKNAIQHYWKTRTGQLKPGRRGGKVRDQGKRAAVTGGKQLDGFLEVIRDLLKEAGIADAQVFTGQVNSYLPGYFRGTAVRDSRPGLRQGEPQTRTIDRLTADEFVNTNPNVAGGRGSASNFYKRAK
ncbi:MAG: PaeR7I family type II restriction endonuclease [Burkholderiales bacterium]